MISYILDGILEIVEAGLEESDETVPAAKVVGVNAKVEEGVVVAEEGLGDLNGRPIGIGSAPECLASADLIELPGRGAPEWCENVIVALEV